MGLGSTAYIKEGNAFSEYKCIEVLEKHVIIICKLKERKFLKYRWIQLVHCQKGLFMK